MGGIEAAPTRSPFSPPARVRSRSAPPTSATGARRSRVREELAGELLERGIRGSIELGDRRVGGSRSDPQPEVDCNSSGKPRLNSPCTPASRGYTRAADGPLRRDRSAAVPERTHDQRMRASGGQRDPHAARQAEAGPEGREGEDRDPAARSARVRAVREGLRHDPRRPQVRARQGEPDPQPVPDLAAARRSAGSRSASAPSSSPSCRR